MIPTSLLDTRASNAPILSVYLNDNGLPSSPRLHELLKEIRTTTDDLPRAQAMSVRADIDRIEGLAPRLDRSTAPAVAIFACNADGLFEVVELPEAVWDVAVAGPDPYLRPLRAITQAGPIGVVVVERGKAWVFTVDRGVIEKVAEMDERPLKHPKNPDEGLKQNYGGWQGYAERRARNHAGELIQRHYQEAALLLSDLHSTHRFGHVVVGGHSETLDAFIEILHPSLRSILAGSFTADPRTLDRGQVKALAASLVAEAVAREELVRVEALLDQAGAGRRAELGLARVLFAANLHAVDRMFVAGTFAKPGRRCDECGWLSRNHPTCEACDGPTSHVGDVVAAAIERVLADGGNVDQVRVASRLDAAGVGATLRFPIPDGI